MFRVLQAAVVFFLVAAATVLAGPARSIYELKIVECGCSSGSGYCVYKQMGYGNVYESFSSGSVSTPLFSLFFYYSL